MYNLQDKSDFYLITHYKQNFRSKEKEIIERRKVVEELLKRYEKLIWKVVYAFDGVIRLDNSYSPEDFFNDLAISIYKALKWSDPKKINQPNNYTFHATFYGYLRSYAKYSISSRLKESVALNYYTTPYVKYDYYDEDAYDKAFNNFINSLTKEQRIIVDESILVDKKASLKRILKRMDLKESKKFDHDKLRKIREDIRKKFLYYFQKEGFFSNYKKYKLI
jgi:hypothetical protein